MTTPTGGGATQNLRAISGNLVLIQMGGKTVGYVQSMTASEDYNPEPLSGVGDIHVHEHVPTQARYQLSIERACLRLDMTEKNLPGGSLMTIPNGAPEEGLWHNGEEVLKGWVFDVVVISGRAIPSIAPGGNSSQNGTGGNGTASVSAGPNAFRTYYNCSLGSATVRIAKHAIIIEDAVLLPTHVDGKNSMKINAAA